jgi:uncharacterized protein (DUF2236 family)
MPSNTDWALGPGCVSWDVLRNPAVYVVGLLREAMLLTLHPPFAAAAADHETIHTDPIGRYRKIARFFYAGVYGTKAEAERASHFVRRRHAEVTGTEPISGEAYQAHADYELVLTHVLLSDSLIATYETLNGRQPEVWRDQFVLEHQLAGALLGIHPRHLPGSHAELRGSLDTARRKFAAGEQARTILKPFATGEYPEDSVFRQLPAWQYKAAGTAVRMLTDMALSTMHPEDRHVLAIDRPPVLRSSRLVGLSFEGLARFMDSPRGRAYFDKLLLPDVAKIYRRALATPPAPFTVPDAEAFVVEIDGLVHNMPEPQEVAA